ncbi:MAG: ornithine cyclodeaminase family protein [Desulfovibrio sp.]|uniref:ornithine cyclodeaminase family protein n=1 Tax=Desulfovibrio sp. TaxID=885 RepID=UPI00135EE765|nr:ornithine cyclodeaminase family protein [Desulfovibrio sp.]MTJ92752.1 ornithine cyclodeaminase family protein [Desulfovibrio sp.]
MLYVSEETAKSVVTMADAIEAIEGVFSDIGRGEAKVFPVVMGHGPKQGTSFSMKSGLLTNRGVVGLKVGSYWPDNRKQGQKAHASTTLLLDPDTGYARALIGASHMTALRTAAADAVAVRHLSRHDSSTLAIFGAGHQAWYELLAICEVRKIEKVFITNRSKEAADAFARRVREELSIEAAAAAAPESLQQADIIVTVTAAHEALFPVELVRAGTHISAMGADGEGKQELDPALVAKAELFADVVQQSITVGEYEKAFKTGLINNECITPLGAVLNGQAGRTSNQQITVFDSSGMALQDIAICALALEKALGLGLAKEI